MDGLVERFGWKKVAIGIVGFCLLGLMYIAYSFLNIDKTQKTKLMASKNASDQQDKQQGDQRGSGLGVTKTPLQEKDGNLTKTYTTPYYQISYPENFSGIPYTTAQGVLDNLKLNDSKSHTVEIVVFSKQAFDMVTLTRPFEAAKYTKRIITVNSSSAVEYKGGMKNIQFHEKVVFIQQGNIIIKFQTSYAGAIDMDYENSFDAIVMSTK